MKLFEEIRKFKLIVKNILHPQRCVNTFHESENIKSVDFELFTKDGIKLSGILAENRTKYKGTILACHYLGGNKEAVLNILKPLINQGFTIVSYDYRGHGKSDNGKLDRKTYLADFNTFFHYIETNFPKNEYLIFGFSMGATLAIEGLAKYSKIKGGVIDSGPLIYPEQYYKYILDIHGITDGVFRKCILLIYKVCGPLQWVRKRTVKNLKKLRDKKIIFIHGTRDSIITINNMYDAKSMIRQCVVQSLIINRARHLTAYFLEPKKYYNFILKNFLPEFVEEIL